MAMNSMGFTVWSNNSSMNNAFFNAQPQSFSTGTALGSTPLPDAAIGYPGYPPLQANAEVTQLLAAITQLFRAVEGSGTNPFSGGQGALSQPFGGTGSTLDSAAPFIPMSDDRAIRELGRNFKQIKPDGGSITNKDLRTIANGGSPGDMDGLPSPELQAAARHILDNPALMDELDTAGSAACGKHARHDGCIGEGDVNAALQRTGFAEGEKDTVRTLLSHFKELKGDGDMLDIAGLKDIARTGKLADGSRAPDDVLRAARDIANRPELAAKLDNAVRIRDGHGDRHGDGLISKDDLNENLSGPMTFPA